VHDEDDADVLTVWPPLPLLTNPQVDMSRQTLSALQAGHCPVRCHPEPDIRNCGRIRCSGTRRWAWKGYSLFMVVQKVRV
jgi:hypothetical protein